MTVPIENEHAKRIIANLRPGRWLRSEPQPSHTLTDGVVEKLVLHQGGAQHSAKKV